MAKVSMVLGEWSILGGVVVAFLVAGCGGVLLRRRRVWLPPMWAGSVAVGWLMVAGGIRALWLPRGMQEHLVLPALAVCGLAVLSVFVGPGARRWLAAAAVIFAGCWLAGSGVARPDFWRVVFGVVVGAWLLRGAGAATAQRGLVVGLVVSGALWIAGGWSVLLASLLVLVGASIGMLWIEGATISVVLLSVGVIAAELAAGGLVRGRPGMVDVACGLSFVVPGLTGWISRRIGQRLGSAGLLIVPALLAVVTVGVAWVAGRLLLR